MPEGDTIHRTAASLAAALGHSVVTRFETPRLRRTRGPHHPIPRPGERIDRVEARGKHLLIRCTGGLTLHTHMRMNGSWHLYRSGQRWRRSARSMVVAIGTADVDAVCFAAPMVELLTDDEVDRHPVLAALGPDLCDVDPDLDEVVHRLRSLDPATETGVALLDQTMAAGIGNVYRAEAAWACGIDPFRPIASLGEPTRRALYATASRLLRANLGTPRRTTVPGGFAVYERAGRACPRCGSTIATRRQGERARSVWWCPRCQR
ncbi:MAG TPA: DNA-formamidopyrimidine glycosylase family protein [Actinomycetota bacterium]|nr:DNA-formamidopyrimidine glycosylase family protein [Actinomycetota bacterium]